jgi:hypothetical protein
MKIVFVAKLGTLAEDKFHVIIPKAFNNKVRSVKGKQVKLIMDTEL